MIKNHVKTFCIQHQAKWQALLLPLLGGMVGAALLLLVTQCVTPKPTLATVNLTSLVNHYIQALSTSGISSSQWQSQVKTFANELDSAVVSVSQENHLILLPSEAVIAGAPDVTFLLMNRLPAWQSLQQEALTNKNNRNRDTNESSVLATIPATSLR